MMFQDRDMNQKLGDQDRIPVCTVFVVTKIFMSAGNNIEKEQLNSVISII